MPSSPCLHAFWLTFLVSGCGLLGSTTTVEPPPRAELRPDSVLLEVGRLSTMSDLLRAPDDDIDTLEELVEDVDLEEEPELVRDLIRARLAAIETAHSSRPRLQQVIADAQRDRVRAEEAAVQRRVERRRQARARAAAERRARQRREADERRERAETRRRTRQRAAAEARRASQEDEDDEDWGDADEDYDDEEDDEDYDEEDDDDYGDDDEDWDEEDEEDDDWDEDDEDLDDDDWDEDGEDDEDLDDDWDDEESASLAPSLKHQTAKQGRRMDRRARNDRRRRRRAARRARRASQAANQRSAANEAQAVPTTTTRPRTRRSSRSRRARRARSARQTRAARLRARRQSRAAAARQRRRRARAASAPPEVADDEEDQEEELEDEEELAEADDEDDDDDDGEDLAEEDDDDAPTDAAAAGFVEIEREARERLDQATRVLRSQHSALRRLARRFDGPEVPEELRMEIDFALLWAAWRTGHASAGALAEEFTSEHSSSGDLLALAWMIRGEVAEDDQEVEESLAAFRFGMNRIGEPVYAYALWRSASVQQEDGDTAAARESLRGVEAAGCEEDAPDLVRQLSYEAADTLGHDIVEHSDGVLRPDTCRERTGDSDGWRPEE